MMLTDSTLAAAEASVAHAVLWLRLVVEVSGAMVIAAGLGATALLCLTTLRTGRGMASINNLFSAARLRFARYLAFALELQLGADILSTAVAPSWDQIGKLGAIAVIRTALNYFLRKELSEETRTSAHAEG